MILFFRACREIFDFLYESVDDAHLEVIKVVRDVHLVVVRVDQTALARTEVHEGVVAEGLLFREGVCWSNVDSVLYDLLLECE